MEQRKTINTIIIILSIAIVGIATPLIYRKATNYYISKKVKQKFMEQGTELPETVSLPEFIISLDTNSTLLLDIQIGLQLASGQDILKEEIVSNEDVLEQIITREILEYDLMRLRSFTNRVFIKESIKQEINQNLLQGKVEEVFFEKYLFLDASSSSE